jgi:hypothetical protein
MSCRRRAELEDATGRRTLGGGAVVVFMLWLYVTGLMVLVGVEVNAVLTRRAEEKRRARPDREPGGRGWASAAWHGETLSERLPFAAG